MLLERLLENLALEVEAFATCLVAPGWRLRLPALDWVTFHFVVQGQGEALSVASDGRLFSGGSLVLVPPGLVHGLQCGPPPHAEHAAAGQERSRAGMPEYLAGPEEEVEILVVCGRAQVIYGGVGVFDRLQEILVLDFADEPKMWTTFEALLEEVRSPGPGSRAMVTALMSTSLVHVFRRLCLAPDCHLPWLQALKDSDLRHAVTAMLERPEMPHTVATLASLCHMSRSAFARRFQESFGSPPMAYLRAIRLRQAARMLRSTPPPSVSLVARKVGFGSRSQFTRAFKQFYNMTPSGFRA